MRFFIKLLFLLSSVGLCYGQTNQGETISLRDKIGQMLIVGFAGKSIDQQSPIVKFMAEDNVGGIILYGNNIESPEQVKQLTTDLQQFNHAAHQNNDRSPSPLLIAIDYEGGIINRLKESYGFPKTYSAAEVGKMSVLEADAQANAMAKTLQDYGFNLDFAPVVDVNVNPNNPIIALKERSFSADPHIVAQYASIYSRNFLQHGVQCAYKHFPGHGSSSNDSHLGFVDVTDSWQSYELDPYRQLFSSEASCGMVMTAHVVNRGLDESGLPATLSKKILTGLLRQQLKFDGVIITDDMQMKAISDHFSVKDALTLSINAGADMLIISNQLVDRPQDPNDIVNLIEEQVQAGKISQQRIDDAYQHIVHLKQTLG